MNTYSEEDIVCAAKICVEDCMQAGPDEKILVVYDESTRRIADGFAKFTESAGYQLELRRIEFTGAHGGEPDVQTAELMKRFPVVLAPTRFSLTHTDSVRNANKAGARVATLPGIDLPLFISGMKTPPEILAHYADRWMEAIGDEKEFYLRSRMGTDLYFTRTEYPLMRDDGLISKAGAYGNLPAGEVFFAPDPSSAEGTLVLDGSIGGLPWDKNTGPANLRISRGRIVEFKNARARDLQKMLDAAGPGARQVAECGIGLNPDIKLSGNLLGDEKIKGTVHIAFGNNCSMGGDNNVPIHIDGLVLAPILNSGPVCYSPFILCM